MPISTRLMLHDHGPALWPDHKALQEVLDLQATTPATIWSSTYQGSPTPPQGTVFMRSWFESGTRYDISEAGLAHWVIGRWISWDTGLKDEDDSAYAACIIGELWPDYRLAIRHVYRERLTFPDLPEKIEKIAGTYNRDGKLRGIIIEDKASGTSALQTLAKTADKSIRGLLIPFMPHEDKETRASQAAVWAKNGSILLPHPSPLCPWLLDFEDELFDFPGSPYMDQVDSFSQLILWLENLLSEGWKARNSIQ